MMRESSWFVLVGDAVGLLYSYVSDMIVLREILFEGIVGRCRRSFLTAML